MSSHKLFNESRFFFLAPEKAEEKIKQQVDVFE